MSAQRIVDESARVIAADHRGERTARDREALRAFYAHSDKARKDGAR
jgi:hypothetical protein